MALATLSNILTFYVRSFTLLTDNVYIDVRTASRGSSSTLSYQTSTDIVNKALSQRWSFLLRQQVRLRLFFFLLVPHYLYPIGTIAYP